MQYKKKIENEINQIKKDKADLEAQKRKFKIYSKKLRQK